MSRIVVGKRTDYPPIEGTRLRVGVGASGKNPYATARGRHRAVASTRNRVLCDRHTGRYSSPKGAGARAPARHTYAKEGTMYETTPSDASLEAIREHLIEARGLTDVGLGGLVTTPGSPARDEQIVYLPERPSTPAQFVCTRCPGQIFRAAPPSYGDPRRNAALVRQSPVLAALGHGLAEDGRSALVTAYDRGELGAALLALAARGQAVRTGKRDRPAVNARREHCQQFLLAAVADGARVDDALDALAAQAAEDPARYAQVVGEQHYPMGRDTYRGYWRALEPHRRAAALERSRAQCKPARI